VLSPRLRKRFAQASSWEAVRQTRERFEEKAWDPSTLNWMSYADLNFRLPELLLMRLDKMSMAVSLEAREPFLDHKLIELAMSIPGELKVKNGVLKYILKKAVRGVIPDELIDRKKQGFGVPMLEWSQTQFGDYAQKELKDFCKNADIFDYEGVLPHMKTKGWALLNVAMWWKQYIGSPETVPPPLPPGSRQVDLPSLPVSA
jgi:asparagine synthase (glutamine-hydrolysing)